MEKDKRIPELPKEFTEWADKQMTPAPIFYQIKGNKAQCRCGKCNAEFEVRWQTGQEDMFEAAARKWQEKPVRFADARCLVCGHEGSYEWKRVKNERVEPASFWIMQRTTENDAVVRIFKFLKHVIQGSEQILSYHEAERLILKNGAPERYKLEWRWYSVGGWDCEWEQKKTIGANYPYCDGRYPTWNEELAISNQKYFAKAMPYYCSGAWLETQFIIACCNNPAIEMYAKFGMKMLVSNLVDKTGKSALVNRKKNKPEEQLKIKKERLKDLIESEGDLVSLNIYQMEKKSNRRFTNEQFTFMKRNWILLHKIQNVMKFVTLNQLMNRTALYFEKSNIKTNTESSVLNRYLDYLNMRNELGYDMKNTVFLFPKNLDRAHAKMVKEQTARKDELYIAEKTNKFPMSEQLIKKLEKQYSFEIDGYTFRPAMSVEEIILEGRTLHHCVGGDTYLKKHTQGKSTICFLRKPDFTDVPYITIEIKDDNIIQWYGANDKKPDREIVEPLLEAWQQSIRERKQKKKKSAAAVADQNIFKEAI